MTTNGEIPENITQQSVLAWQNIIKLLESAKMDIRNIVKITQYITIPENIPAYSKIRSGFLGDLKPASTLLLTPQLALAEMLVEVEIIAASLAG